MRDTQPSLRIPRAVELWFAGPKTPAEQRIRELIARQRKVRATAWEQELFAQKKRLADTERKLAVKVTKAASESKRIAGNKVDQLQKKLAVLSDHEPHQSDGRMFPMHHAPIIMQDGDRRVVRLARYHCRMAGKQASVDTQYPGLCNERRDNIANYWRPVSGIAHAVMLADGFYENVDRDGKNAVLHFVRSRRTLC